ncbi:MAG: Ig-like domain-containing protein, partial [Pseudoprimorskyibacter sp.]|nr:Ig-like domain-containing protein [Pseudoprimorskyibacter sp.]
MPTDFNSDYVQIGTDAAENLTGDSSANYIEGEDGADTLDANGGNDQVDGGAGHDVLYGDDGNDSLFGNDGSDTIFGGNGDDVLHGGGGLTATATTGSVDALSDIDYTVTTSKPSIYGSADTDFRIAAASGQSVKTVKLDGWNNEVDNDVWLDLTTFADDFKLKFTKGDANDEVVLYGDGINIDYGASKSGKSSYDGKGSISYTGADGNRHNISFHVDEDIDFRIEAATADTTYTVSEAGDTDTGADVLDGGDGNDSLIGGGGADSLSGGSGNDVLSGNSGADTLTGGSGSDTLNGGSGNDVIEAGSGDFVSGGAADDTITADPTLFDENASANAAIYVDGGSAGSDADTLDLTAYEFYRNLSQSDDTGGGSTSGTIDVQNSGGGWTTITFVDIESLLLPTLLDVTPPVVTLTALGTVTDTTPTISGTVDDATATVVVLLDGTSYTAVNNGDGSWVLDGAAITELGNGAYTATVTATDGAGNQDTASDSFVVDSDIVNGTSGNDLIRVGYVDTDGDVVGDSGTNVIEAA